MSVDTRWCSGHRGERFRGQQLTVRHVVVTRDDLGVFVGFLKKLSLLDEENQGFSSKYHKDHGVYRFEMTWGSNEKVKTNSKGMLRSS